MASNNDIMSLIRDTLDKLNTHSVSISKVTTKVESIEDSLKELEKEDKNELITSIIADLKDIEITLKYLAKDKLPRATIITMAISLLVFISPIIYSGVVTVIEHQRLVKDVDDIKHKLEEQDRINKLLEKTIKEIPHITTKTPG